MNKFNDFNVTNVELEGRNIIEASAGTGKTFSIAILVIRLIIEKNIDIEKILMVTFTNAAVAELSERIRLFIKQAYFYLSKNSNEIDKTIQKIIDNYIQNREEKKEQLIKKFKRTISFLDEAPIYTIHGFCNKTLNDFTFETNELINNTFTDNEDNIIENAINKFWRKNIINMEKEKLKLLTEKDLKKDNMISTVKKYINGEKIFTDQKTSFKTIKKDIKALEQAQQDEYNFIVDNVDKIASIVGGKTAEKIKNYAQSKTNKNPFIKKDNSIVNVIMNKLHGHKILELLKNTINKKNEIEKNKNIFLMNMYEKAALFCIDEIEKYKEKNSIITQNDLIIHLNKVASSNNKNLVNKLKKKLSNKYNAIFIDEFQDTDTNQYNIFSKLFDKDVVTFFIGDPKQSIYKFRGADLDSYKNVINNDIDENRKYTMKTNFRSSENMIKAMNIFFVPQKKNEKDAINVFNDDDIKYIPVECGNKEIEDIKYNNVEEKPFTLLSIENKGDIPTIVANQINELLCDNNYKLSEEKISLSKHKIGVLVRTKQDGLDIKNELTKYNINSVLINDKKVLKSDDARDWIIFLEAINNPTISSLKKLLITPLIGSYKIEDLSFMDNESFVDFLTFFKELKLNYDKNGIFVSSHKFLNKFSIKREMILNNKHRSMSNIQQIMEIIHSKEKSGLKTIEEIISWMKKNYDDPNLDNEYEERVESDINAIEITTIHKSKGLDYNIVFAPYLNLNIHIPNKLNFISYKNNGNKYFAPKGFSETFYNDNFELYKEEEYKENIRLIYVTITRAINKIYLVELEEKNDGKILNIFLDSFKKHKLFNNLCDIKKIDDIKNFDCKKTQKTEKIDPYIRKIPHNIKRNTFIESFSSINNAEHIKKEFKENNLAKEYDTFIFKDLKKGAQTGNFLHRILENIDFSDNEKWKETIKKIGFFEFPSIYDKDLMSHYIELLENTVSAKLNFGSLKDIKQHKRFSELEFYFKAKTNNYKIQDILNNYPEYKDIQIKENININGALNGFIDLVFEHSGKYYIVDWKSNFLGSNINDYKDENLHNAIKENNYNLQYLVYSIALKRYLEKFDIDFKNHFGGIIYIFLRGVRKDKNTGIFYRNNEQLFNVIMELDNIIL